MACSAETPRIVIQQTQPHKPMSAELITPEGLAAHLDDPGWRVVDCRFNLMDPQAGRAAYTAGHIPGASYADLDRDLSAPRAVGTGRHPLPDADALRRLLGGMGIGPDTTVVAYDEVGGAIAARWWWLLRDLGHARVALLDGGWPAWRRAGLPVDTAEPARGGATYPGHPGHMPVVAVDGLQRQLREGRVTLLDVRAAERFAGRSEPIDSVAGHVPGARNLPFSGNLEIDGRFKSGAELGARLARERIDSAMPIVCMCGSGVTACHGIFALERGGLPGAALYAGSWSEWIQDPQRPVAKGE